MSDTAATTPEPTYPDPVYVRLRAMKGRGNKVPAADLVDGQVIRVDKVKYRVQREPYIAHVTGSLMVEVYSEDNQFDVLSLNKTARVTLLGDLP